MKLTTAELAFEYVKYQKLNRIHIVAAVRVATSIFGISPYDAIPAHLFLGVHRVVTTILDAAVVSQIIKDVEIEIVSTRRARCLKNTKN